MNFLLHYLHISFVTFRLAIPISLLVLALLLLAGWAFSFFFDPVPVLPPVPVSVFFAVLVLLFLLLMAVDRIHLFSLVFAKLIILLFLKTANVRPNWPSRGRRLGHLLLWRPRGAATSPVPAAETHLKLILCCKPYKNKKHCIQMNSPVDAPGPPGTAVAFRGSLGSFFRLFLLSPVSVGFLGKSNQTG